MKTPAKILYVDDQAVARKFFEHLVGNMAPVVTASSVEEGKEVLRAQAADIAVLVSDQRMPGALGNELLRYSRENHPSIVRMLTTAYSELGEAIEAINSGEIYRYISKPWDMESLRADLTNALELAELRRERDGLLQEKMLVQQQQLLGNRVVQLAMATATAAVAQEDRSPALHALVETALKIGCRRPTIDWNRMDHADLLQSEAQRGIAIGRLLCSLQQGFGSDRSAPAALAALQRALPTHAAMQAQDLRIGDSKLLTWTLDAPAQEAPNEERVAWMAWLVWLGRPVGVQADGDGVLVRPDVGLQESLPSGWMADGIQRLAAAGS